MRRFEKFVKMGSAFFLKSHLSKTNFKNPTLKKMDNLTTPSTKPIKHWYMSLIIGVFLIIFGLYLFSVPAEAYITLVVFFSLSFIFSGIVDIFFSIQNQNTLKGWAWYLINGVLSLLIGIYLYTHPLLTEEILPYVVGFILLFRSVMLMGFSFDLKEKSILGWGNLLFISILGIIFSFLILYSPVFTTISLAMLTAFTFIFVGIGSVVLSLSLKKGTNSNQ